MKPEQKVRNNIRDFLRGMGWGVYITHGSLYQYGFPDLYCMHKRYGTRWIDAKVKNRYSFTNAQKLTWPKWYFDYNVGTWILIDGTEEEYTKLFQTPNFLDYWRPSWGDPKSWINGPDIDKILEEIK